MFTINLTLLSFMLLVVLSSKCVGFQLNPLEDKYKRRDGDNALLRKITSPVHEEITSQAVLCAKKSDLDSILIVEKCNSSDYMHLDSDNTGYLYNPLIRGVWWNDDPNQLLFRAGYAKWQAWMHDGDKIAKTGKNYLGRNAKITKNYYMQYRSHYGDLQFLHGMAHQDEVPPQETLEGILAWAEFAYAVAIGKILPETLLSQVDNAGFQSYFNHRGGWTVNYLFAPKFTLGEDTIDDVALGSILHMIQDSYSEAHADRAYDKTEKCPNGRVLQFHSYVKQNHKLHGVADTRAAWLESKKLTDSQNPVRSSAMLIKFVQQKADWASIVLPYMRDDIFCLDDDARVSSPGSY